MGLTSLCNHIVQTIEPRRQYCLRYGESLPIRTTQERQRQLVTALLRGDGIGYVNQCNLLCGDCDAPLVQHRLLHGSLTSNLAIAWRIVSSPQFAIGLCHIGWVACNVVRQSHNALGIAKQVYGRCLLGTRQVSRVCGRNERSPLHDALKNQSLCMAQDVRSYKSTYALVVRCILPLLGSLTGSSVSIPCVTYAVYMHSIHTEWYVYVLISRLQDTYSIRS